MLTQLSESQAKHARVLLLVGLLDVTMTPWQAYDLYYNKILPLVHADLTREIHELQDTKRAEGDPEWYQWSISVEDYLSAQDADFMKNLREELRKQL
jgi:hypothetical protein